MLNRPSIIETATFGTFEAYAAAIEDADLRCTLPRLERASWSIHRVSLADSIHIQIGNEGGGNIAEGASREDGFTIFIPGFGLHRANGIHLESRSAFVIPPGADFCLSSDSAHNWLSVFIPIVIAPSIGLTTSQASPGTTGARVVQAAGGATYDLRSLVERFVSNAVSDTSLVQRQNSVRTFHSSLLLSVSRLFNDPARQPSPDTPRPSKVDYRAIRSAVEMIEDAPNMVVTISDLVVATGVSERTLRSGFHKFFGVSPRTYMQLRQFHQARKLLSDGRPGESSVSEVATSLGFWDFGRFAAKYKRLFGEFPSDTLKFLPPRSRSE